MAVEPFYFAEIQKNLQGFVEIIQRIDDAARREKCKAGLSKYLVQVLELVRPDVPEEIADPLPEAETQEGDESK